MIAKTCLNERWSKSDPSGFPYVRNDTADSSVDLVHSLNFRFLNMTVACALAYSPSSCCQRRFVIASQQPRSYTLRILLSLFRTFLMEHPGLRSHINKNIADFIPSLKLLGKISLYRIQEKSNITWEKCQKLYISFACFLQFRKKIFWKWYE